MMRLTLLSLAAGVALAATASANAAPSEALWQAIVHVESGGNVHAFNPRDGAAGVAQIRLVCLADANRIARDLAVAERFTPADRHCPAAARRIWNLYLTYYGRLYERMTGRPPTDEVYARIWNGGPSGWRRPATAAYWDRVRSALQRR